MYVYLHENALWYYLLYIYSQCQAKHIKIKYLYLRKIFFVHIYASLGCSGLFDL